MSWIVSSRDGMMAEVVGKDDPMGNGCESQGGAQYLREIYAQRNSGGICWIGFGLITEWFRTAVRARGVCWQVGALMYGSEAVCGA